MKIEFLEPHLSITGLECPNLPDLTVLTGLNGAGKTHFLKALELGRLFVANVALDTLFYFDNNSFRYNEGHFAPNGSCYAENENAWIILEKDLVAPNKNYFQYAETIYDQFFGRAPHIGDVFWQDSGSAAKSLPVTQYEDAIEKQLFNRLGNGPVQRAIVRAIRKSQKAFHKVDRYEFDKHYVSTFITNGLIPASLGGIFAKYSVVQFLDVHRQIGPNEIKSPLELFRGFAETTIPPWDLVNEMLAVMGRFSTADSGFNFQITSPKVGEVQITNWGNYQFTPQLIDQRSGESRNFDALSSGEKIILGLAICMYQRGNLVAPPNLLLLDEIDASLHPSMTKALLHTLQEVFVDRGTKVILATHSPSTVAQAPEGSVHIVSKTDTGIKIAPETQNEAVNILSEGFMTLDDGLSILKLIPSGKLAILTEGHNTKILQKLLDLHKRSDVVVLSGAEAISSKNQLEAFFKILSEIGHSGKFLCVWDCDYTGGKNLKETDNTYAYTLPQRQNEYAKKGVENAFSESVLEDFVGHNKRASGKVIKYFDGDEKASFAEMISKSDDVELFSHFNGLMEKIDSINNTSKN